VAVDPRHLRTSELALLLNSTPLGTVVDTARLHRHRTLAGFRIGNGRRIDLLRYVAWLFDRHSDRRGKGRGVTTATADDYKVLKDRAARRNREVALAGRDIGPVPDVVNPKQRAAARRNFRKFCDSYFPDVFALKWSKDHIRVLGKVQRAVLKGAQLAFAMPRGSGKTSVCEVAAIWATAYGHRRFVVVISASETAAYERLDTIVGHFETNERLAADFPEVCFPIAKLEGIANRCRGQLSEGMRTQITWTQTEIVLPTIEASPASSAIVKVAGITGRIRGMKFQRPDGASVRPDLVIVDDPQTDQSAHSLSQCATRERILAGAVLGLAGPSSKIAALMPCTVIRAGDMADNILDSEKHPEWNGERTRLIDELPKSKLWDQYGEIRSESYRKHGDIREATAFYKKHRRAMDKGAKVAWSERYLPDEISAVQFAMNLKLQDEASFWAEYQNEPLKERGLEDSGILSADQLASKLNNYGRGVVPIGASQVTCFIDVQQKVLYWLTCAWESNFSGYILDYGAFPDQGRSYFTLSDAKKTLGGLVKGAGLEGSVFAGLEQLTATLLGREWRREDGTPMRVDRCLIDASWGATTDVVYQFARQSDHAAVLLPSHGRYVGPTSRPFQEWAKKPGDRVGLNWRIPGGKGRRAVKHALYDTNFWKTFVHSRFAQAMGDPGCLSLYGRDPSKHRMLSEHLTAEFRERSRGEKTGRVVDVWKLRPGARDNHLFDCLVGCAVAASISGAALPGMDPAAQPRPARRVRLSDLQRKRRQ